MPAGEEFELPVEVYNFSEKSVKGNISIRLGTDSLGSLSIELPPMGKRVISKAIRPALDFGRLEKPLELQLKGNFGSAGESIVCVNVRPELKTVAEGDIQYPLKSAAVPGSWRPRICKNSSMNIEKEGEWVVFNLNFNAAVNTMSKSVWASPPHRIRADEMPKHGVYALAIDWKFLGGPLERAAVTLTETNGSAYEGSIPINIESLKERNQSSAIIPLSSMFTPGTRKKDPDGKLDIDKLYEIEISMWGEEKSKLSFAVKDIRWIAMPPK